MIWSCLMLWTSLLPYDCWLFTSRPNISPELQASILSCLFNNSAWKPNICSKLNMTKAKFLIFGSQTWSSYHLSISANGKNWQKPSKSPLTPLSQSCICRDRWGFLQNISRLWLLITITTAITPVYLPCDSLIAGIYLYHKFTVFFPHCNQTDLFEI